MDRNDLAVCEVIFVYFVPYLRGTKTYKFVSIGLTFVLAFLAVNNISSYTSASEDVPEMKKAIVAGLEKQEELYESDPEIIEAFEIYKNSVAISLTESRFRQHSLFRIIGCLLALVGVVFLRLRKSIGLHLFLAGMFFVIFTGFYSLGMGVLGWILNIIYFFLLLSFGLYYFSKRKELV